MRGMRRSTKEHVIKIVSPLHKNLVTPCLVRLPIRENRRDVNGMRGAIGVAVIRIVNACIRNLQRRIFLEVSARLIAPRFGGSVIDGIQRLRLNIFYFT